MGLLPLIFSTLTIFTSLVIVTLLVSFILYKIKSPKKKPYLEPQAVSVPAPIYIQKVSYEALKKEPVVYYQEPAVTRTPQPQPKHYSSAPVNRFQVVNSQGFGASPSGLSFNR